MDSIKNKFCRLFSAVFIFLAGTILCPAQTASGLDARISSDEVWENSNRKVRFDSAENVAYIRLKNYYGLWLDTEYKINFDFQKNPPFINEDSLYVRYWQESQTAKNYYLPCANFSEITLDEQVTDENVYGYYFSESEVFVIRYWKCSRDVFDAEKKISLNLSGEKNLSSGAQPDSVFIPKYIQIADDCYTCIQGRGEKIRNVKKIERKVFESGFADLKFLTQDGCSYLVLQKPYLVKKSKI